LHNAGQREMKIRILTGGQMDLFEKYLMLAMLCVF